MIPQLPVANRISLLDLPPPGSWLGNTPGWLRWLWQYYSSAGAMWPAFSLYPGWIADSWPVAIPCPWRYVWSASRSWHYSISRPRIYGLQSETWAEMPAGRWYVPTHTLNGSSTSLIASGTRSYECHLWSGPAVTFTIPTAATRDDITVTATVSGAGGYTAVKTFPALAQSGWSVAVTLAVPTPWDEERTVLVTWTGGGSSVGAPQVLTFLGTVYDGEIPEGWEVCGTYTGRYGRHASSVYRHGAPALQEYWRGIGQLARLYNDGSADQLEQATFSPAARLHSVPRTCLGYSQCPPTLSKGGQSYALNHTDTLAPWVGVPTMVDGELRITTLCDPIQRDPRIVCLRKLTSLRILFRPGSAGSTWTITVTRANDWRFVAGSTDVTLWTGTYTKAGADWETLEIPLSYPFGVNADFDAMGHIHVGGLPSTAIVLAIEEPCPPPVTIPTQDGHAIPGAVAPSAPVARGVQIVEVSGTTFAHSDIPTDAEVWAARLVDVPAGYYQANARRADGSVYSTAGVFGLGVTSCRSTPETQPVLITDGACSLTPYQAGYGGFSQYGRNTRTDRVVDRITLDAITVTSHALSLGANDLTASDAAKGIGSTLNTTFLFQRFTAPSAGVYRFALSAAAGYSVGAQRFAVWRHDTDQLCPGNAPAYEDEDAHFYQPVTGVAGTPPTATSSPDLRTYAINSGTGSWAGRDGQIATGWDPGDSASPITWDYTQPPQGHVVSASALYVLRGSVWTLRTADLLTWEETLASGQTVYYRIGRTDAGGITQPNGGPVYAPTSAGALTLTVESA